MDDRDHAEPPIGIHKVVADDLLIDAMAGGSMPDHSHITDEVDSELVRSFLAWRDHLETRPDEHRDAASGE